MGLKWLLPDETDLWLEENDPYYRDSNKWKANALEYPYHTVKQQKYRRSVEIPFSNVFKRHILGLNIPDVFHPDDMYEK